MNKNAVYYLKYGALLHVGFAYWMLTNKQMFYNEFEKLYYKREVTMPLHTVYDYPADHTLYVLGFCVIVVAYLIFFEVFYECFSFLVRPSRKKELCAIEGLPPFWMALSNKNLDTWINEELLI